MKNKFENHHKDNIANILELQNARFPDHHHKHKHSGEKTHSFSYKFGGPRKMFERHHASYGNYVYDANQPANTTTGNVTIDYSA